MSMNTIFQNKPDHGSNRIWRQFAIGGTMLIAVLSGAVDCRAEVQGAVSSLEREAARTDRTINRNNMRSALKQPLNDLNLLQSEVPSVLQDARSSPYTRPAEGACDMLISEVQKLDAMLGPDLDLETIEASFKQKASGKALDLMREGASSVIPYRGAVRFVSGAQKHDRVVAEARRGGEIRRAYLKGVGESMGCPYPGSPLRTQISASPSPSNPAE
jgi:hypothetical protein